MVCLKKWFVWSVQTLGVVNDDAWGPPTLITSSLPKKLVVFLRLLCRFCIFSLLKNRYFLSIQISTCRQKVWHVEVTLWGRIRFCDPIRLCDFTLIKSSAGCCLHRRRLGKPSKFPLTATKKWLFDLKNWGAFVLQKARKDGHLRVPRLQFLRRDQRRLRLPRVAVDSQPCDLPMTNFSCLLQHKGAPIFQIKQPLFCSRQREL